MGIPITKNRMVDGGDKWIIGGDIAREGATPDDASAVDCLLPVHYQITPAAKSATAVHAAIAMDDVPVVVTTGITNPDVPRVVTVKGNASGITGNVVITGTNAAGDVITDTIALNGATEVAGAKAFDTVTQIDLPVETHAGTDTVSIGRADVFGLPHIVYNALMLLVKIFDGSTDAGSLAVDADELEKNLYTPAGTPNGSKVLDLIYLK
ncbi:MAG: hypothetical protein HY865_09595 [Chloroflexi bacterium]|nr:hypothetical protein [Chloroflexota bacterium]